MLPSNISSSNHVAKCVQLSNYKDDVSKLSGVQEVPMLKLLTYTNVLQRSCFICSHFEHHRLGVQVCGTIASERVWWGRYVI